MLKSRLTKRENLLFLTPALLLIVPLSYQFRGDKLDRAQRNLAGTNAIDCGIGHSATAKNNVLWQNRAEADACAVRAFKAKKPFRVRFDCRIDDYPDGPATESTGIVGTPQGQVYFFYYMHYAPVLSRIQDDYQQAVCPKPIVISGKTVGCGTCSSEGSADGGYCLWGR